MQEAYVWMLMGSVYEQCGSRSADDMTTSIEDEFNIEHNGQEVTKVEVRKRRGQNLCDVKLLQQDTPDIMLHIFVDATTK